MIKKRIAIVLALALSIGILPANVAEAKEEYKVERVNTEKSAASDFVISGNKLLGYKGKATKVVIPDTVKVITCKSFWTSGYYIKEIVIPKSVTTIYDGSFASEGLLSLEKITVKAGNPKFSSSNGVLYDKKKTKILAYPRKKSASGFSVGSKVTEIAYGAFYNTKKLKALDLKSAKVLKIIGKQAFQGSGITELNTPRNVKNIYREAFYNCSDLKTVKMEKSTMKLGTDIFRGCSELTSVTLPEGLKKIPEGAFSYCRNLKSVYFPKSLTAIENKAFFYCENLTFEDKDVTLKDNTRLTKIGDRAFSECDSISVIHIPDSIEIIGKEAFYNWADDLYSKKREMRTIFYGDFPQIGKDAFSGIIGEFSYPYGFHGWSEENLKKITTDSEVKWSNTYAK